MVCIAILVAGAHAALIGWLPLPHAAAPLAPVQRFVMRSIERAPPPAPAAPAAAVPPAAPQAAPAAKAPAVAAAAPQVVRPAKAKRPEAAAHASAPPAPPRPETSPQGADLQAPVGEAAAPSKPDADAAAPSVSSEPAVPSPVQAAAPNAGAPQPQALPPPPLQVPPPVHLFFSASGQRGAMPMQGVYGELRWHQDGQSYEAELSLKLLFRTLRRQHSRGTLDAWGIAPERFSETRRSEVAAHFVRERGTILFSSNAPAVPLLPGAQDRLSVVLQIGALLAGDPARHGPGSALAIQTAGTRDADVWIFKIGDDEELALPAGRFLARKLTRNPREPFDDKLEVWVAPALGWLPVRIRQTQPNGDFADLQLREAGSP